METEIAVPVKDAVTIRDTGCTCGTYVRCVNASVGNIV